MKMVSGLHIFLCTAYREAGVLPKVGDHISALLPLFDLLEVMLQMVMVKVRCYQHVEGVSLKVFNAC